MGHFSRGGSTDRSLLLFGTLHGHQVSSFASRNMFRFAPRSPASILVVVIPHHSKQPRKMDISTRSPSESSPCFWDPLPEHIICMRPNAISGGSHLALHFPVAARIGHGSLPDLLFRQSCARFPPTFPCKIGSTSILVVRFVVAVIA